MSWILYVLVSFWNGFVVVTDFLVRNFLFLVLFILAFVFVALEMKNNDTYIDDERKLV